MNIALLLFQSGYLTVDKIRYRGDSASYLLKMPNLEVKESFNLNIVAEFTETDENIAESYYWRIKESLETGNLNIMLETTKSLFASIPYEIHVKKEAYYHSLFYAILRLLGFDIEAEISVSGRIDAVLELKDKLYIIEFKYRDCEMHTPIDIKKKLFDEMLKEGFNQIKAKNYETRYICGGKTIFRVVLAFLGRDDIEMSVEVCNINKELT